MNDLFTDYPFVELGDTAGKEVPIRKVLPISYYGNKYCQVIVYGIESEIKAGYIYTEHGRCGDVPVFRPSEYNWQQTKIEENGNEK